MLEVNVMHSYEMIEMLSTIMEEKDSYTAGHSKRVAYYATGIAEKLSLSEDEQNLLYQAGTLHDIGKILTPETILLKPKKLTKKEFQIVQKHALDGEKILESVSSLKDILPIIRHHHENYDGNGYPSKLAKDTIPLLSRILCVADSFDAMTTNRIYQRRKTNEQAIEELHKHSGKQFDPNVVKAAISFFTSSEELTHINQLPKSEIHEERLAFYYKDRLSSAYSCEYLDLMLKHKHTNTFRCAYLIDVHHMYAYNNEYGWKAGNILLKEIVKRVHFIFEHNYTFRVFGDDFIVLCQSPLTISLNKVMIELLKGLNIISLDIAFFSLEEHSISSWEDFEPYLKQTRREN